MTEININIDITNTNTTNCPICDTQLSFYTIRYPHAICVDCMNIDIKDTDGNSVMFHNIDIHGGFVSLHTINNDIITKEDHICWVKNVKCYAKEARYGGIVIETI